MFFDSHAHLNFKAFKDDYRQVVKRCQENNVWLINAGSQYETSRRAVEIAEEFKQGVWAAVGLHPIYVDDKDFDFQKYLTLAKSSPKVVAVGETGLDYYHGPESKTKQKEIFLKHLELAQELKKPVIIHCRLAHEDLIEILKPKTYSPRFAGEAGNLKPNLKGVIHCFTGNQQQAEKYLEMGFYLGFTGIITYSSEYDEIIKTLPLEKILIETDSPYLTPLNTQTNAEKSQRESVSSPRQSAFIRNEPLYVKYVAEKIAAIHGLSLEIIAKQTTSNALKLFGIML
jgi:TatD DNase family protein